MRGKVLAGLGTLLLAGSFLQAQYARPQITRGVTIEQNLNSPVPLDLLFHDETGQTVPLRTYFGEKPVIFSLVYFKCPSLCPMSLRETVTSLRRMPLQVGLDYNVVVVSFDPSDTPAAALEKKNEYAKMFGRAGFNSGWHFLTGSQDSISRLASAIGFGYRWDEATKQFVHASGIMVATPDGRMSRYFFGTDYAPADLRLALADAAKHKISRPVDFILQFCFHYDVSQGKYTLTILNILKVAGFFTVLGIAALVYYLMRNDKKQGTDMTWRPVKHVG
ncbi:MAG: SCO family protein [Acidobacteriaceae bacterium]|nr:SCO family protein [Acidobacteriaceae bacterium]